MSQKSFFKFETDLKPCGDASIFESAPTSSSTRARYVGVKLRSQQDIMDRKKVREAVEDESKWFQDHAKSTRRAREATGGIPSHQTPFDPQQSL